MNFASDAVVRAAIMDVIDARDIMDLWEGEGSEYSVSEDQANASRMRFADAVQKRIHELQSPPHDGVRLEDLCDRHKRAVLPTPTAMVCTECENERKE